MILRGISEAVMDGNIMKEGEIRLSCIGRSSGAARTLDAGALHKQT